MNLERLGAALDAVELPAGDAAEVRDLAYDARDVTPGALFFCVPGQRADGHDFAPEAVANGAAAVPAPRSLPFGATTKASSGGGDWKARTARTRMLLMVRG